MTTGRRPASSGRVVGAGWHDTCLRWDISTPQRVVGRLEALDGQGSMLRGKKLFAERDRFGKWQHLLGPQHVLLAYTVDSPTHGLIEVQAHLGNPGEDDLCPVDEFPQRWSCLQKFMAMIGVLRRSLPTFASTPPSTSCTRIRSKGNRFSKA